MHWLIGYDISCDRRRARVAKRLERVGLRVQKSVFVAELSRQALRQVMDELAQMIDQQADAVAAWKLQQNWQSEHLETGMPQQPVFLEALVW